MCNEARRQWRSIPGAWRPAPSSPLSALLGWVSGLAGAPEGQAVTLPRARFGEVRRRLPALPLTDCRFSSFLSQEPAGWPWAPCRPCAAHVVLLASGPWWGRAGEEGQAEEGRAGRRQEKPQPKQETNAEGDGKRREREKSVRTRQQRSILLTYGWVSSLTH